MSVATKNVVIFKILQELDLILLQLNSLIIVEYISYSHNDVICILRISDIMLTRINYHPVDLNKFCVRR